MNSNYNNQDRTPIPSLFEINKISKYFLLKEHKYMK